ncbi:MAG: flagellar assembly protein T N-terminal domain-containing protein [Myxococcota bacterium]
MTMTALAVYAPGARAQEDSKTVEATGQAAIVNGDAAGARDRAKKDALRNAVEMVAGANVTSVTTVKDFQLVSDAVASKAEGFVKEYKILEEKNEGGVVTMRVSATVSKSAAADAFSLALMEAGHPKVAFIIAERMAGQTDFSLANQERGKSENMMVDYFQQRGLTVVDLGGLAGINLNGTASTGQLSAQDAEYLREKADAQYAVVGTVVGVDAGPIMQTGLRSYNMSLTLKMFNTNTNEVVATVTKSNAIPCTAPNLAPPSCSSLYRARVVDAAAQELLEKTSKSFVKNMTGTKRVQMHVTVANFGALQKFIKALPEDVRGVASVQQRSFKGGKAVLDVELEGGDTNYLASELSAKKIGGAAVEVNGVNPSQLEIEIKK